MLRTEFINRLNKNLEIINQEGHRTAAQIFIKGYLPILRDADGIYYATCPTTWSAVFSFTSLKQIDTRLTMHVYEYILLIREDQHKIVKFKPTDIKADKSIKPKMEKTLSAPELWQLAKIVTALDYATDNLEVCSLFINGAGAFSANVLHEY